MTGHLYLFSLSSFSLLFLISSVPISSSLRHWKTAKWQNDLSFLNFFFVLFSYLGFWQLFIDFKENLTIFLLPLLFRLHFSLIIPPSLDTLLLNWIARTGDEKKPGICFVCPGGDQSPPLLAIQTIKILFIAIINVNATIHWNPTLTLMVFLCTAICFRS